MEGEGELVPACSVAICTRDRPEHLERCLRALAALSYPRFEVVVVDNAPSDGRARELAARWSVRYVIEPLPGLSRARNCAARCCTGELIAYLDDDAAAASDWLGALAREFADPRVMAVTGRVLPPCETGAQQRMCAAIAGADRGPRRRVFDRQSPSWFASANFGGIGIGANMAVRKDAFGFWPGFNPRLGRGSAIPACEENHAFFELIAAGYRVVYTPHAVVRHHAPADLRQLRDQHLQMMREAGAYLAFMLTERREHRAATLKFILEGLGGRRRFQGEHSDGAQSRIAPRWRELCAGMHGGLRYAAARLSGHL